MYSHSFRSKPAAKREAYYLFEKKGRKKERKKKERKKIERRKKERR